MGAFEDMMRWQVKRSEWPTPESTPRPPQRPSDDWYGGWDPATRPAHRDRWLITVHVRNGKPRHHRLTGDALAVYRDAERWARRGAHVVARVEGTR